MPSPNTPQQVFLRVLESDVRIECRDIRTLDLVLANYGEMQVQTCDSPSLKYQAGRCFPGSGFRLVRDGREPLMAADDGEFLFLLEKDLTVELQKIRRDLYFLHAAALAVSGRAFLLVAASGKGKSTTTWALLHHGVGYLSDELAPLDLTRLEVQPYPHALCLKKEPPRPYLLPENTVRTCSTLHIPTALLPGAVVLKSTPIAAIFFTEYRRELELPKLRRMSGAEAAARLFVNALNPLAHTQDGLAGAAAVAQNVPSFHLESGALGLTCETITSTLKEIDPISTLPTRPADCSSPFA